MGFECVPSNRFLIRMYVSEKQVENEGHGAILRHHAVWRKRAVAEGNWGKSYWLQIKETTAYLCSDGCDLSVKENMPRQ